MFCFCFLLTFTPIFYFKRCSFVGRGAKIFLTPGAKYPSCATECDVYLWTLIAFYLCGYSGQQCCAKDVSSISK